MKISIIVAKWNVSQSPRHPTHTKYLKAANDSAPHCSVQVQFTVRTSTYHMSRFVIVIKA